MERELADLRLRHPQVARELRAALDEQPLAVGDLRAEGEGERRGREELTGLVADAEAPLALDPFARPDRLAERIAV